MRRFARLGLIAIPILLSCLMSGCRRAPAPVLVAGTVSDRPPFAVVDEQTGQLIGYEVDLLTALAAQLEMQLELRALDPTHLIPELMNGRIDVAIATTFITEENGRETAFTDPYLISGHTLMLKVNSGIATIAELREKKIGIRKHTTAAHITARIPGVTGATIQQYGSIAEALQALVAGEVDSIVDDVYIVNELSKQVAGYVLIWPKPFTIDYCRMAIRPTDERLREALNRALARLKVSGELDRLAEIWLGQRSPSY